MIPILQSPTVLDYTGTLAAGARTTLSMLEYWCLLSGSGLSMKVRGKGRDLGLPLLMLFGDGSGEYGAVEIINPTGAPVAFRVFTSSRLFNPSPLAAAQNVSVTSFSTIAPVEGVDADGAATTVPPVRVSGLDGANGRSLQVDAGGRAVVMPFGKLADRIDGQGNPVAAAYVDVIAAVAGKQILPTALVVSELGGAAAVVTIAEAGVERFRMNIAANDTRVIPLPSGMAPLAIAAALQAKLGGAGNVRVYAAGVVL